MNKESFTLNKKLKQYSALASSILATTGFASAQVIYTDIDPDSVYEAVNPFPGDLFPMDMNNDGIFDFVFLVSHDGSSNVAGLIPYPVSTTNPNAIAGTLGTLNGYPFGYVGAYALNENIGSSLPFFNMADLSTNGTGFYVPIMFSGSLSSNRGNWPGLTDHYVGVSFSDGANNYYGWIRCDIAADGSSLTVKDYAYNSTPDEPLFAGQGSPLQIATANQSVNFRIFGYEGAINIFVNDGKLEHATVTVINMLGETVINQSLTDRTTHIDLNQFAKGIYLVTVQRGEEVFSKKISFR